MDGERATIVEVTIHYEFLYQEDRLNRNKAKFFCSKIIS